MSTNHSSAAVYDQSPVGPGSPALGNARAARDRREVRALLPASTMFNRGFALVVMLLVAGLAVFLFVYGV